MKCLLIETKDKRKFFTQEKNFIQLIEFSKTFDASLSVVDLKEGKLLEIEELASAICDPNYTNNSLYKVLENKSVVDTKNRVETMKIAETIKKYIFQQFEKRNPVSLTELKKKFKKYELSDSALCKHIRKSKIELEKQGYKFVKTNTGEYKPS